MVTRIAYLFGLVLLATCLSAKAAQEQPLSFQFLPKPGPYAVGFKVIDQYDYSRNFGGDPRPIQTLVWYPAASVMDKPMTVGSYAQIAATVIHFHQPDKSNEWAAKLATYADVQLRAVRDAKPRSGRFPVLVYAPGDSSVAWENADLCEYLASHGYVVLASPSLGVSTRDMTDDVNGINAQAHDISFLVGYAKNLSDTDISKIAVAGWSWGGISNLFAAAHDSRIKALIAFDGSMRYYPKLVEKGGVHPGSMTIPLLFFTRGYISFEKLDRYGVSYCGASVLNSWNGDLWTVHMLGMSHPEFASMYQRAESAKRFAENQIADYGREDANVGYGWVARYTLAYLNAYLKDETTEMDFLKRTPTVNGVAKHFMSVNFRAAHHGRTMQGS